MALAKIVTCAMSENAWIHSLHLSNGISGAPGVQLEPVWLMEIQTGGKSGYAVGI